MEPKNYTIDQVHEAFRNTFLHVGERFFPYPEMGCNQAECEEGVKLDWDTFVENLPTVDSLKRLEEKKMNPIG